MLQYAITHEIPDLEAESGRIESGDESDREESAGEASAGEGRAPETLKATSPLEIAEPNN